MSIPFPLDGDPFPSLGMPPSIDRPGGRFVRETVVSLVQPNNAKRQASVHFMTQVPVQAECYSSMVARRRSRRAGSRRTRIVLRPLVVTLPGLDLGGLRTCLRRV